MSSRLRDYVQTINICSGEGVSYNISFPYWNMTRCKLDDANFCKELKSFLIATPVVEGQEVYFSTGPCEVMIYGEMAYSFVLELLEEHLNSFKFLHTYEVHGWKISYNNPKSIRNALSGDESEILISSRGEECLLSDIYEEILKSHNLLEKVEYTLDILKFETLLPVNLLLSLDIHFVTETYATLEEAEEKKEKILNLHKEVFGMEILKLQIKEVKVCS